MSKRGVRVAVAMVALAFAITAGEAAAETKRKKIGFFESLFGESTPRKTREIKSTQRKRKSVFGNRWWEEQEQDGVRNISGEDNLTGKKRKRIVTLDDDPEGDPGLGMGNLTYAPDRVVPLGGANLTSVRPTGAAEAAIYDAFTAADLAIRVLPEAKEAILAQYASQNYRSLWTDGSGLTPRGKAILSVLADAGAEGLDPAQYLPPVLASFETPAIGDAAWQSKLDIGLTAMAVKYARHASAGQFDPRRLSLYNDIKPQAVPAAQALRVLAWTPYPAEYLRGLQPRHPAYGLLKAELAKELNAAPLPPPEPIADGPIIKPGHGDERLALIRTRLDEKGFAPPPDHFVEDPLVLDEELSARLKAFQKAAKIKVSGMVGPQTIAALNGAKPIDRRMALANNMDRLRWLPKDLGKRHVFVNQAGFEVRVMNAGAIEWRSRVIVGRPFTQTAVFHDEMETVVFNPSWGVPQSIIRNEYLPKLRNDPDYLDRIGFKVVNASGEVVRSSNVDWWGYESNTIGIQQPPGSDNALGELKFLFPNSHDIYMHDTPTRELFEHDERAFSHGCVRVQNPREFAEVMLGWDALKVAETVDSGKSQSVKLPEKVPVHLTYFTAWPDETGKIAYFADIYGRDKTMENARSALTIAQR